MARSTAIAVKSGSGFGQRRSLAVAQCLLLGGLVILATPSAMLVAVLLLPTAMVALSDGAPGRPASRAMALFGLAGACAPLDLLWRSGHTIATAVDLAMDLRTLAVCWTAQAAGWLLTQLLPLLAGLVLQAQANADQARLVSLRDAIEAEWPGEAGRVR